MKQKKWSKVPNFIGTEYISEEDLDLAMMALAGSYMCDIYDYYFIRWQTVSDNHDSRWSLASYRNLSKQDKQLLDELDKRWYLDYINIAAFDAYRCALPTKFYKEHKND